MARHRGSSRPEILARPVNSAPSRTQSVLVWSAPSQGLLFCALLAVGIAVSFFLPTMAWGQVAVEDVHVKPRVEPPQPKHDDGIDPALRTHTKPVKVDVDLVLVPVTITDPMNRLVTGLDRDNFALFEGKDQQEIKHFSSEDAPVSLGVIFDVSGSMSSKIERAREAVVEFFKTANPQDEFGGGELHASPPSRLFFLFG